MGLGMNNETSENELLMKEEERKRANETLVKYLEDTLNIAKGEVVELENKLAYTYWVIVVLSIIMFIVGIVLISVPAVAAFRGSIGELQSIIAAGFGFADLAALFLFRPISRIHKLMGDMSQIIMAINSYQTQVALRLLEMDSNKRETIGKTAEHVKDATKGSIKLIQEYFESKEPT